MAASSIPYEMAAKNGEPMPDGLSALDVHIFQAIACLAARYRMGRISAEQSQTEMRQIRDAYETGQLTEKRYARMIEFWKSVEWALNQYGRDRTPENAETMWRACGGLTINMPEN